jgi:hypothetical protein
MEVSLPPVLLPLTLIVGASFEPNPWLDCFLEIGFRKRVRESIFKEDLVDCEYYVINLALVA